MRAAMAFGLMPFCRASALKLCFQLSKLAPVLPHLAASAVLAAARITAVVASNPIHLPSLMPSSAFASIWGTQNVPPSDGLVTAWMGWHQGAVDAMPNPPSAQIEALFPTFVYRTVVEGVGRLNHDLEQAALALAESDEAGRRWCA